MKTKMVSLQELGRSTGGETASKGWSQVNQDDHHCAWAHDISKHPPQTGGTVNRDGRRIQGSYKDHGFHSRKPTRKEQPPKCRSRVSPHFKIQMKKKCPPKSKKTPPNSIKKFSNNFIDHDIRSAKKQDWSKRKEVAQQR
jgi:hypothetical protein